MKNEKTRPGVMLYFCDFATVAANLDDVSLGKLLRAILDYAQFGVVPEFDDPALKIAFGLSQPRIDADGKRYLKKVRHTAYMDYVRFCKAQGFPQESILSEPDWIAAGNGDGAAPTPCIKSQKNNPPGEMDDAEARKQHAIAMLRATGA